MVEKVKKILITGACGMLAKALKQVLSAKFKIISLDIKDCELVSDITDKTRLIKQIKAVKPDYIIHTAAITDVDCCEQEKDKANAINNFGTRNVAEAARESRAILIYISTDYVFDGKKKVPYQEEDIPNPLNFYGKTKLAGEKNICEKLDRYFIIRSSGLYGPGGRNFVDTILNKAKTKELLRVVNDQIGAPTYTLDLADALRRLLDNSEKKKNSIFGIYNITNSGSCTWFEFAKKILEFSGIRGVDIVPIKTIESGRAAIRPKMSKLDNAKFNKLTGFYLRPWDEALASYLADEYENRI